jgi:hypothetical protein
MGRFHASVMKRAFYDSYIWQTLHMDEAGSEFLCSGSQHSTCFVFGGFLQEAAWLTRGPDVQGIASVYCVMTGRQYHARMSDVSVSDNFASLCSGFCAFRSAVSTVNVRVKCVIKGNRNFAAQTEQTMSRRGRLACCSVHGTIVADI